MSKRLNTGIRFYGSGGGGIISGETNADEVVIIII